MLKIGVCVSNFGPSQLSYNFLKNANEMLKNRCDISVYGFYENLSRPLIGPSFGIFNMTEVYGFDGVLVTTTVQQTFQTLNFPRPSKRVFYVNDIEWVRHHGLSYEYYQHVFRSKIRKVARSEEHAYIIKNCFNIGHVDVNPNFNLEELL